MITDKIKIKDDKLSKIVSDTRDIIGSDEVVYVALKGTNREYLICSDKMVHIIKKGFMTDNTFGGNDFRALYCNITNAAVNKGFISASFIIATAGMQSNIPDNWSNDKNNNPRTMPNAIGFSSTSENVMRFREAANFILGFNDYKTQDEKTVLKSDNIPLSHSTESSRSDVDEIMKYKKLLDAGALTEEEFSAIKKKILGI